MRLIDADSLLASMDNGIQGTAREYLKYYQMAVNDEHTAYNADKVIEQIKASSTDDDGIVCYVDKKPVVTKELAIKIVKSGGID